MKKTRIAYVISEIHKSLAFEWISKSLDQQKFTITFILLGNPDTELAIELRKSGMKVLEFPLGNKFTLFKTFLKVSLALIKIRPNVVHTHLFYANLIGLTAAWILRTPKRVMTRHHAMIHYNEIPKGLKWDKLCNELATDIVAISKNIRSILIDKDGTKPEKIHLLHHRFDLNYFQYVDEKLIRSLREKYSIPKEDRWPVIGAIARYVNWKGIQYIIPAFHAITKIYPTAHLVLANASGNFSSAIKAQLESLPVGSYTEIVFEENLATLYRLFDIYVHVPIDKSVEAFGQTYVEALACGIPSVFTLSGVASEFIVHEKNALVVPFCDSESIYRAVLRILEDAELRNELIVNGKKSVNLFTLSKMIDELTWLYEN